MGKRGRDNWPMMPPIRWLRESACHNATGFGFRALRETAESSEADSIIFKFIDRDDDGIQRLGVRRL